MRNVVLSAALFVVAALLIVGCGGVVLEENDLAMASPFVGRTDYSAGNGVVGPINLHFEIDGTYTARWRPVLSPESPYAIMRGTYETAKGTITFTCEAVEDRSLTGGAAILSAFEKLPFPVAGETAELKVKVGKSFTGGSLLTLTTEDGDNFEFTGRPMDI